MDCLGCRLSNQIELTNTVYEDHYITCILDIAPFNEGHVLILPKQHIVEFIELDQHRVNSIFNAVRIVSKAINAIYKPDGITVIQNGGIFNDLGHFHMHVFPRYKGDGFGWVEPINDASENLLETCRKIRTYIKDIV